MNGLINRNGITFVKYNAMLTLCKTEEGWLYDANAALKSKQAPIYAPDIGKKYNRGVWVDFSKCNFFNSLEYWSELKDDRTCDHLFEWAKKEALQKNPQLIWGFAAEKADGTIYHGKFGHPRPSIEVVPGKEMPLMYYHFAQNCLGEVVEGFAQEVEWDSQIVGVSF